MRHLVCGRVAWPTLAWPCGMPTCSPEAMTDHSPGMYFISTGVDPGFDGWDECFKPQLWTQAFDAIGIDPAWYAHRERSPQEVFPWNHLHGGAPNDYLLRQYDDVFTKINVTKPSSTPAMALAT